MATSAAHIRATGRYETKAYDKVLLRIRKDGELTREIITNAANKKGMSLNAYILEAVAEKIAGQGVSLNASPVSAANFPMNPPELDKSGDL